MGLLQLIVISMHEGENEHGLPCCMPWGCLRREAVRFTDGLGGSEGSRQQRLCSQPAHPAACCACPLATPQLGAGEVSKYSHHCWKYPIVMGVPVTPLQTLVGKDKEWPSSVKGFVMLLWECYCSSDISRGPSSLPQCVSKEFWGKNNTGENFMLTDLSLHFILH